MQSPYALRSKGPLPAVVGSGATQFGETPGVAGWTVGHNPLYSQSGDCSGVTAGSGGQGTPNLEVPGVRLEYPTPQRLDFELLAGDTPPVVQAQSSAVSVAVSGMQTPSSLLGQMSALHVGSVGTGGRSQEGLLWSGTKGLKYLLFRNSMRLDLGELRGKGRNAQQQLERVAARIMPLSFGMKAHDLVVDALQPQLLEASYNRVINPVALCIPALEHMRTGMLGLAQVHTQVVPTQEVEHLRRAMGLIFAMGAKASGKPEDEAKALQAVSQLGTQQQLVDALSYMGGGFDARAVQELVQQATSSSASTSAPVVANMHGWLQLPSGEHSHPVHGVHYLRDMPVLVYWLTMNMYFAIIGPEEVLQIKQCTFQPNESLVDMATRLAVSAEAVRQAHAVNPSSSSMTEEEELEVYLRAVEGSAYASSLNELRPTIRMLPMSQRNAQHVGAMLQHAWQVAEYSRLERAKLEAIVPSAVGAGAQSKQAQVGAASGSSSGSSIHIQHSGIKHVEQCVSQMPARMQDSVLRSLMRLKGLPHLESLVNAEPAAAAGLSQHRAMQGQPQAGLGRSCTCVVVRHPAGVKCFTANPKSAPSWWAPPKPGHPNYDAYVQACQADDIQPRSGGGGVTFPAAVCAEVLQEYVNAGTDWCAVGSAEDVVAAVIGAGAWEQERLDVQLDMDVSLSLGRDNDIVEDLLWRARQGMVSAAAVEAAAAAGMFSFGSSSAQQQQLQQAAEWAEGTVMARVTIQYPRDRDLLQQLLARNALLRCSLGRGEQSSQAAEVVAHCSEDVLNNLSAEDRLRYIRWKESEGGLVYFANASKATGVVVVAPDGREFLPHRALDDPACQVALMDLQYGTSLGLHSVEGSSKMLRGANGKLFKVEGRFVGLRVGLARGTANEVISKPVDFWAVPGLASLAEVIIPTTLEHAFAVKGIDRVDCVFRYRPKYLTQASEEVAELPVLCHKRQEGVAVVAMLQEEDDQQLQQAVQQLLVYQGRQVVTHAELSALSQSTGMGRESMRQHFPQVLRVADPHESYLPGGQADWHVLPGWVRLQYAQFGWACEQLETGGQLHGFWQNLGQGAMLQSAVPYDWATIQPVRRWSRFRWQDVVANVPFSDPEFFWPNTPLADALKELDGYSGGAGVWDRLNDAAFSGGDWEDTMEIPWDTMHPAVLLYMTKWSKAWLSHLPDCMDGAGYCQDSTSPDWCALWMQLQLLYEVCQAPMVVRGPAAAEAGFPPGLDVRQYRQVAALLDMAVGGLQMLQVATRLRPTVNREWDEQAIQLLDEARGELMGTIKRWADACLRRSSVQASAGLPPSPPQLGPRRRPRYSSLRVMLSFMLLLLVACFAHVASAMPMHPPQGGTFRHCSTE